MRLALDENLFLHIVGGSTGPQMGLMWFTGELHGIEKSHTGRLLSFDTWAEPEDFPLEEPEHVYVELDPEAGKARVQLQTVIHEELVEREVEEGRFKNAPRESTILFYEATSDVKDAYRATDAVNRAVLDAVKKWTRAPYGSGDARTVTREQRLQPTPDYLVEIFQPSAGFFGVDS